MSTATRRCYGCEREKPITAFPHNWTGTDTRHHRRYLCRTCGSLRRDAWRQARTPEQRRADWRRQKRHNQRRREATIASVVAMLEALVGWGWTRTAIAREAGCKIDTVSHWLRTRGAGARTVNRATVEKISRVYLAEVDRKTRGEQA